MTLDDMPPAPRVTVQCSIPRAAADAIDLDTIKVRARDAGIVNASLEISSYRVAGGRIRITTDLRVAAFIVDRLRDVALIELPDYRESTDRVAAIAEAVRELLAAMDQGIKASTAPMSSWFPKNPPTRESID